MKNNILYKTDYQSDKNMATIQDNIKLIKKHRVKNPVLSVAGSNSKSTFLNQENTYLEGEYDLLESSRIIDTEAFVAVAFNKKTTLIFKNGFQITSENKENLEYIKKRIQEVGYISKIKFEDLLREYTYNLVAYHNPYLVKVRKKEASTGNVRNYRQTSTINPIAAYFCLPPETIMKKLNSSGEIVSYRQNLSWGTYRDFSYKNMIYTPFNKRTGMTMATPPLEQVRDDILTLRGIEESVEKLIDKEIFPLIHITVGTDKHPASKMKDGVSEVDAATHILDNMHDNGGVVTSERTSINAIGAESLALRVENYLAHFKKRVYSGLGMSAVDFGEGDNTGKATGEVLSGSLKDSVITYQLVVEDMVTDEIFNELLLESDRYRNNFIIPNRDKVFFKFNDVDPTTRIKKESHTLNKMSSGIITTDESREELGYDPLTYSDLKKLHIIQMKELNNEIDFAMHEKTSKVDAKNAAAKVGARPVAGAPKQTQVKKTRTGNSKTKNTKEGGAKKSSKSIASPKNQHTKDYLQNDSIKDIINNIQEMLVDNNNMEILSNRIYNILIDYVDLDYITDDIDNKINNILADILDASMLNSEKRDIFLLNIAKDIDKLHNIQYIEEDYENKIETD